MTKATRILHTVVACRQEASRGMNEICSMQRLSFDLLKGTGQDILKCWCS